MYDKQFKLGPAMTNPEVPEGHGVVLLEGFPVVADLRPKDSDPYTTIAPGATFAKGPRREVEV